MNNKIIGLVLSLISGFGAVAYGFFPEGAAGSFRYFISLPSFVFVIGVGGGLTFMRKHTINNCLLYTSPSPRD